MGSEWRAADFCCLRTPLLALESLSGWGDGASALDRVGQLVSDPMVREAIELASPSLAAAITEWERDPTRRPGVTRSLVRYLFRMASRPTPFGLCAGVSIVGLGDQTALELDGRDSYRKRARVDAGWVAAWCDELDAGDRLGDAARFVANTAVGRRRGEQLVFMSAHREADSVAYEQLACDDSGEIRAVLQAARTPRTAAELAAAAAQHLEGSAASDSDHDEARELVDAMIEVGLLEPELQVPVHGREPFVHVAQVVSRAVPELAEPLDRALAALAAIAREPVGVDAGYAALRSSLAEVSASGSAAGLAVDLEKPAGGAILERGIAAIALEGVELLRRVCPVVDPLDAYRNAMERRFEARGWEIRETVPLLEALDPELGLIPNPAGAAVGLARSLPLEYGADAPVSWGRRERRLLEIAVGAADAGALEVELSDADIEALSIDDPLPLPDAFSARVVLVADRPDRCRVHVAEVEGPSGARLLGRFCHGDPELEAHVRAHLRDEEALRPGVCFAEVAHLPEARAANVISRPRFRDHVIQVLGHSTADAGQLITLDELELALVDDGSASGRLALFCPRLGVEIAPRLTAHPRFDDPAGLELYRFLAAMQGHKVASRLGFDWGPVISAPRLPRLVRGELVIAPACWSLDAQAAAELSANPDAIASAREQKRWPRHLLFDDPGGSPLLVDFDNPLSVEALGAALGDGPARLIEPLGIDAGVVTSPEGSFAHELIIPFVREPPPAGAPTARAAPRSSTRLRYPPGSSWLDARLAGDPVRLDRVVREGLAELVEGGFESGACDRFFFVRAFFPRGHLRLRFRGPVERLAGELRPAVESLAAEWIAMGEIEVLELATFEPEIARYGGVAARALVDELFTADSRELLRALAPLDSDHDARWPIALAGIDRWLDALGLDIDAKLHLVTGVSAHLDQEFGPRIERDRVIGRRFREHRVELEDLVARPRAPLPVGAIVAELRTLESDGRLEVSWTELARSVVHMHANRVLIDAPRAQELVIYRFLARLYRSFKARSPE